MSKRTLADRSGRPYPHNAIYEILTYRNASKLNHEPLKYNKKALNEFVKMLNAAPKQIKLAYELVFLNGNTLAEAGKIMKMSPSSVRKCITNLFFVKDEHGYMVANLEKIVRGSYSNISTRDGMNVHEHIDWFIKYHCKNKSNLPEKLIAVLLEDSYEGLTSTALSVKYGVREGLIREVLDEYEPFRKPGGKPATTTE